MSTTRGISRCVGFHDHLYWFHNFMRITYSHHSIFRFLAHSKDVDLLNKPIENYQQMQIIFGNGVATVKFAMSSPFDFADSESDAMKIDDVTKVFRETPKSQDAAVARSDAGNKRKRSILSEGDIVVMTDAMNNVANSILQTKVEDVHPDLYDALMFMPGFIDEAPMAAYEHLLGNNTRGTAFVKMNDSHHVLWLRTFLAKHY
nr:uncharacterized protein LOC117862446 [Setaria viridis]